MISSNRFSAAAGLVVACLLLAACAGTAPAAVTLSVTVTRTPVPLTKTLAPVTKTLPPVTRTLTLTQTEVLTTTEIPATPQDLTLNGTLELRGADNWESSTDGCMGTSGYDDLRVGAGVIVYDANGNFAGAGALDTASAKSTVCTFSYTITGIAGGSKLYLVEITKRGKLSAVDMGNSMLEADSFIGE